MVIVEAGLYLEIQHGRHQSPGVGQGQITPLVEDRLQLPARDLVKMELNEAVPEGPRQNLKTRSPASTVMLWNRLYYQGKF